LERARHQRACPALGDHDWIDTGLLRVLDNETSGRGFLQGLFGHNDGEAGPDPGQFFDALKSPGRLRHLRNFTANHLALSNRKVPPGSGKTGKANDMFVLKSLERDVLRQGAPKGKKVLIIWDKAGIDFLQWQKWKQAGGIYFLSLEKDNMRPQSPAPLPFDKEDPVNAGVISDELAGYGPGVMMRRVTYKCPETGRKLVFLTSLTDSRKFPPGLIAQLYRMRWDIENPAHTKRMEDRLDAARQKVAKLGKCLPKLYEEWQRIKQTGVTFIRWLRGELFKTTSWERSLRLLRRTYKVFKA
jgi:hypothetical protein